jgi:hypothetical protein
LHYFTGVIDADLRIGRRENVIGPGQMQGYYFFRPYFFPPCLPHSNRDLPIKSAP